MSKKNPPYNGFEQGPIRPPSEANSLLIRITRNCPWNRCTFCYVYKHDKFSIRPVEDIKKDIDTVHKHLESIAKLAAFAILIPLSLLTIRRAIMVQIVLGSGL